jgi:hypothetical protein
MPTSDLNIILSLNNATIQLNRYYTFIFLISSIASLLAILFAVTSRMISNWTVALTFSID